MREALTQGTELLTDVHELAVHLRETYTPNCGYTGPYPYDQGTGRQIAEELRRMAAMLRECEQQLDTAATALNWIK